MVSHARESKYVCHFCDKAFYGENTLKVHFKKHLRMQVSDAEQIGYVCIFRSNILSVEWNMSLNFLTLSSNK